MGMSNAVRVSIRVRPFNRREIAAQAELSVKVFINHKYSVIIFFKQVDGTQCTAIHNQEAKTFGYDECFWSHDKLGLFFNIRNIFEFPMSQSKP